jgi:hypothetical protein
MSKCSLEVDLLFHYRWVYAVRLCMQAQLSLLSGLDLGTGVNSALSYFERSRNGEVATTGAEHVGSHEYVQLVANRTKAAVTTTTHEIEISESDRCHGWLESLSRLWGRVKAI